MLLLAQTTHAIGGDGICWNQTREKTRSGDAHLKPVEEGSVVWQGCILMTVHWRSCAHRS